MLAVNKGLLWALLQSNPDSTCAFAPSSVATTKGAQSVSGKATQNSVFKIKTKQPAVGSQNEVCKCVGVGSKEKDYKRIQKYKYRKYGQIAHNTRDRNCVCV